MSARASQITRLTIVYSIIYSGANQRRQQSSASLTFVWGIHRWPVNSPHKGPVTRKIFPFYDVIMRGQVNRHNAMDYTGEAYHCHAQGRISNAPPGCLQLIVIGIDHDMVCAGVVCAATPGTARVGRPSRGRLRPAHECCAGSGSTNHDSADRMSGQFLFYHENEAKHNDKSRDGHDDERHAESPWLTTPLWWWKRP